MNRRESLKYKAVISAGVISSSTLLTIFTGCRQEMESESWSPSFLSSDHLRLVQRVLDLWLPRTESPGALDLKIDRFLDKAVSKMYDEETKVGVKLGLDGFNQQAVEAFGKTFLELNDEEATMFLMGVEQIEGPQRSLWGAPIGETKEPSLYRNMKFIAYWAFFNTEVIAKEYLNYDPIPGEFKPCIPIEDVGGKAWSI